LADIAIIQFGFRNKRCAKSRLATVLLTFFNAETMDSTKSNPECDLAAPLQDEEPAQPSSFSKFPKIVPFDELCRCGDEIWISNGLVIYRLQRTKLGKLILTK